MELEAVSAMLVLFLERYSIARTMSSTHASEGIDPESRLAAETAEIAWIGLGALFISVDI